ncbi:Subtilisin-like protease SBT1.8 [Camellia lanceoleosa]|uniref:Subtilisin-like protease SBT1.8 n=1 Tax=Camellia lanceoleosa TaxID=1840588 RepID=A0ACC0II12_9ERIC|nr:Subtilisin-like protease SBT1.8 [Camellia lanceoleosa]
MLRISPAKPTTSVHDTKVPETKLNSTSLDHNNHPISSSNFQQLGTLLDFGAGHISPQLATDLGLIFDIDGIECIDFLCCLNYSASQLYKIVEGQVVCEEPAFHLVFRLNYPSFSTIFNMLRRVARLWRTMTHMAELRDTYTLTVVNSNLDIMISVVLKQLQLQFS